MKRNVRLRSLFCFLLFTCILTTGCFMSMASDDDSVSGNVSDSTETGGNVAPTQKSGYATVNVTALNMRSGPGPDYDIIGVLGKSQAVLVLAKSEDWYVVYDYETGHIGCVNGYYITLVSSDSMDDPKLPGEDSPSTGEGSGGSTNNPQDSNLDNASSDAKRLMSLVNDIRTRHGKNAVKYSASLSKVAQDKAEDMVRNMYFSHQSELYGTPFEMMRAYGITFTCAAENIAGNQAMDGAFYAWMNSDSHKENIMNNDYDRMGIGVCVSPIYGKIIVQMFVGS